MINRPISNVFTQRAKACSKMSAIVGFVFAAIVCAGSNFAFATDQLSEGSSSKKLRLQTVNSLPYQQLNAQTKAKISDILQKPSIYRRLPVTAINADPDYFRFLIRYPEVIVNIWQMMGVTNMATDRTGPYTVDTNDGAGTLSSLELVYGSENLHIFYGSGSYEGPVLKRKLRGKAVLVLRSESSQSANGKPISTSQLDVFLKVDNATAGLIAKTISPLVGTTADHNFVESLKFVERLHETTSKNGPGVQQMGKKLDIDDSVRKRFNEVVDVVFQRAINGAAPLESRVPARPASMKTSLQTRPSAGSQYQTPTPRYQTSGSTAPQYQNNTTQRWQMGDQQNSNGYQPRGPNTGRTQRGAVYEQLNDLGQSGRTQGNLPQAAGYRSQSQVYRANGQLPARGYQAPAYSAPGKYAFQYQQQTPTVQARPIQGLGQPVQASYNYPQEQPRQLTNGWRPQR